MGTAAAAKPLVRSNEEAVDLLTKLVQGNLSDEQIEYRRRFHAISKDGCTFENLKEPNRTAAYDVLEWVTADLAVRGLAGD